MKVIAQSPIGCHLSDNRAPCRSIANITFEWTKRRQSSAQTIHYQRLLWKGRSISGPTGALLSQSLMVCYLSKVHKSQGGHRHKGTWKPFGSDLSGIISDTAILHVPLHVPEEIVYCPSLPLSSEALLLRIPLFVEWVRQGGGRRDDQRNLWKCTS